MSGRRAKAGAAAIGWALGLVLIALTGPSEGSSEPDAAARDPALVAFDAQLGVIAKTDRLLAEKFRVRIDALAHRVRVSYMLLRAGWAPTWLDPEGSAAALQRRALSKRLLGRAHAELTLLRAEITAAVRARSYIEGARAHAAQAPAGPAPGSLAPPVRPLEVRAGVGAYTHPSGARLTRRGIELAASPGASVQAPAAGTVRYAAAARGLDNIVVIDHGGYRSIVAGLGALAVTPGERVAAGAPLATAAGDRVYLEVRLSTGAGGHPVDPAPLLAR